jgi:hypothetical protein
MTLLAVAGLPVTRGRVVVPREGAWHADLWLDANAAPSGPVALSWGDEAATWQAFVVPGRAGVFTEGGPAAVRVVGGAGGLGTELSGQSYRQTSARIILGAILGAAGERLSPTSPAATLDAILARWSRAAGRAGAQIDALAAALGAVAGAPVLWRVLPDGSVYVGPEPGGTITLDTDSAVTARAPSVGRIIVASSAPWTLTVGQTFEGARVDEIIHRISDREVRSELWRAP